MSSFEERRRARAAWPIRRVRLGEEERVDPRDASSIDERVALVGELTRQLWAFMGTPIPSYRREDMPGVVIRRR